MSRFSIGVDFGTESARAVLVDTATGRTAAARVCPYADGVIDERLPHADRPLPPDWALQNPADWVAALEQTVSGVMADSGVAPADVVGLGLDFTACTVLSAAAAGTPLCALPDLRDEPHAWAKLWKHHAAQAQADRVNALAARRGEPWLPRYGGRISSEWLLPKALQLLEEAPAVYARADVIVEGADWIVWQLTGQLARNACAAGYKATWHKTEGYPSAAFLRALHPDLADLFTRRVRGPVRAPGERVGRLTADRARRLGLAPGTPVGAAIIDAHAACPGAGVTGPGVMFLIMGTSTCHMLMASDEVLVEGISGVVADGIVPGLYGYEAGQAAVGDLLGWFVEHAVSAAYSDEAAAGGRSVHEVLSARAAALRPGESGLLALDWWNGCRSTLVDAQLGGLLVGCTLNTRAEDIYRALIEATAFGTRLIVEAFTGRGVAVDSLVAGGGLTKNALLRGRRRPRHRRHRQRAGLGGGGRHARRDGGGRGRRRPRQPGGRGGGHGRAAGPQLPADGRARGHLRRALR